MKYETMHAGVLGSSGTDRQGQDRQGRTGLALGVTSNGRREGIDVTRDHFRPNIRGSWSVVVLKVTTMLMHCFDGRQPLCYTGGHVVS